MAGLPDLPGLALDFQRHGESLTQCRAWPGFLTVLAHDGDGRLVGYSAWLVRGDALYAWPSRFWGRGRLSPTVVRLAMAEGRRRGARHLVIQTWIAPAVVRRWLGLPLRHLGDLMVRHG